MLTRWWPAAALSCLACSSSPPPPRPAPAPVPRPPEQPASPIEAARPEPGRVLRARYPASGGAIARYALTRRDSVVSQMPSGEVQTQLRGRTAFVTVSWIATASLARLVAAVDSLVEDPAAPVPILQLDSARGTRWTAERRPGGPLTNFTGSARSLVGDQIRDELALLFPSLPPAGAGPGDVWSDSASMPVRLGGFEVLETGRGELRAGEVVHLGGSDALVIVAIRIRRAQGETTQFDQPIQITAAGTDSLSHAVAADGRVLAASGVRRTEMALAFPAVGQSITAQEFTRLTFRLVGLPEQ